MKRPLAGRRRSQRFEHNLHPTIARPVVRAVIRYPWLTGATPQGMDTPGIGRLTEHLEQHRTGAPQRELSPVSTLNLPLPKKPLASLYRSDTLWAGAESSLSDWP